MVCGLPVHRVSRIDSLTSRNDRKGNIMDIRTFAYAERRNNSASGNPRFKVTFSDGGSYETESDASAGYDVQNLREGDVVAVQWWGKTNRIGRLDPVRTRTIRTRYVVAPMGGGRIRATESNPRRQLTIHYPHAAVDPHTVAAAELAHTTTDRLTLADMSEDGTRRTYTLTVPA